MAQDDTQAELLFDIRVHVCMQSCLVVSSQGILRCSLSPTEFGRR